MVNLIQAFKKTFLPSEEVSAARRQAAFGTTSKKVAGAVIIGSAAAAIAAPALIASAGGARAAATKVVQRIASAPLKSKVLGTVAAGAVLANPKGAVQLPARLLNFGENIGEVTKARSKDELIQKSKDLVKENPLIAGAAGLGLAAVAGKGVTSAISGVANTRAIRENTQAIKETINLPAEPQNAPLFTAPNPTPLTPEVIDVSKPVKSSVTSRKRKKYKQQVPSIRVNVLNQQTFVS